VCLAAVIAVATSGAWAYEVAPDVVIRQLTRDGKSYTERGAGFAPKGDLVVFYRTVSKSDRELCVMNGDGSDSRAISAVGWPMLAGWSPDGTKIGYVFANKNEDQSDACVCVYDLATGDTKRIMGGYQRGDFGAGGDAPPIWAPDGQHLAYQIRDRQRGKWFLWVFPADGTEPVRIGGNLFGTTAYDSNGSWSPDSKQITFAARPAPSTTPEIWRSNIDGTGLFQVTNDHRSCGEPKWSPDGEWIVFFSAKDRYPDEVRMGSKWDILLVRPDGTDEHTIVSGASHSTAGRGTFVHPSWAPDQSYIICHGVIQDEAWGYKGTFLIDWREGKWRRILGTPVGARNLSEDHDWWISPDSKRVFRHGLTYVLRGTGDQAQKTDPGDALEVYETTTEQVNRLLSCRQGKDPYYIYYECESWAPDSERILFCQAKVISWQQQQYEPDLYVLTLPKTEERLAVKGTAPGSGSSAPSVTPAPPAPETVVAPSTATAPATGAINGQLIRPKYLTTEQALACLPEEYRSYCRTEPERNLLICVGAADKAEQIRAYLAALDTPAPQVTMDVLVTEMSKDASRDLGLDWSYAKGRFGGLLPIGDLGPGQIFYQGVGKLDRKFYVNLNALEQKGDVTIRANPRLVALSGRVATINIRRTKYYFYTQGYDQYGRPIIQQSDISADIIGKITPRALGDGHILVDVEVAVGNFTFTGTSTLPDVTSRNATTSVMVSEGETIMIGGLMLRQDTKSSKKTPLLGDLPLIGQLFRSTHQKTEESVLAIFVTPRLGAEVAQPATIPGLASMSLPALGGSTDVHGPDAKQ